MWEGIQKGIQSLPNLAALQEWIAAWNWVDWLHVGFLIAGLVLGALYGLMAEVAAWIETLVIIVLIYSFYPKTKLMLAKWMPILPAGFLDAVAFWSIGIGVWIFVSMVSHIVRRFFHAETVPLLRTLGGSVLGLMRFALLASLLAQAMIRLPIPPLKTAYRPEYSQTVSFIAPLAPRVHQTFQRAWRSFREAFKEEKSEVAVEAKSTATQQQERQQP